MEPERPNVEQVVDPKQPVVLTGEQLAEVASQASKAATAEVQRRNTRRIAIIAFIVGALAASGIGIPATWIVSHEAAADATRAAERNARLNCRDISELASVEESSYRETQTETRAFLGGATNFDRFGLTPAEFKKLLAAAERREHVRIAHLQAIAATDCTAKVARTPEAHVEPTPTTTTTTSPSRGK